MKGNNLVILRGNLGSDPDVRPVAGDTLVELSLATHAHWRDANGILQERTDWHRITAHGSTADWAASALARGDQLLVIGSLRPRTWRQPDGEQRTAVVVRAWEIQQLSSRKARSKPRGAVVGSTSVAIHK